MILANKTGSELHIVYVEEVPRRLSYSESPSLEEMIDPEFEEQMRQHAQAAASQLLEEQVYKIREAMKVRWDRKWQEEESS